MPIEAPLPVVPMGTVDIDRCMDLVRGAGWNQVHADWTDMLAQGSGFCIRDPKAGLIACAVALAYPPSIGWIGMVLVDAAHRQRGYATKLLAATIAHLQALGLTPMLDATPAGRVVYEKMGFVALAGIDRWRGEGGAVAHSSPWTVADVDAALVIDAEGFGARRPHLLHGFAKRPDGLVIHHGSGWLFARAGRTAMQVGPVLAADEGTTLRLVVDGLDRISGPVLLDVPHNQAGLAALLVSRGLVVERSFVRMALGPLRHFNMDTSMRVIAGPELG